MSENEDELPTENPLPARIGQVLGLEVGADRLKIHLPALKTTLEFWHEQNCCESVAILEIDGEEALVEGATLISVEARGMGCQQTKDGDEETTFYTFRTSLGVCCVRWYGTSNGFYSTSVGVRFVKDKETS